MLTVYALSEEMLGLNVSSGESCAVRGAYLLVLQCCLARNGRPEKVVLFEEKCHSKTLLIYFFVYLVWVFWVFLVVPVLN